MSKPVVIATRRLPEAVETRLADGFDARLRKEDAPLTQEALAAAMREGDAVLCTVSDRMDAGVIAAPGRRAGILANFGVGYSNIDIAAAREAGLAVTNTPDVLTEATADIALLLILSSTRRASAAERALRAGRWAGFSITGGLGVEGLGTGLQGKTLGIIGMGRIGRATARRAVLGFGMRAIYFNRSPVGDLGFPAGARASIEAVMAEADVVSLHMPGGAGGPVITADHLARMKPSAHLVNTARGDVIDEGALVAALAKGRLAGAGLDVFAREPHVPQALTAMEQVTLLPHIGSATIETRTAMGMLAIDNLEAHFGDGAYPSRVV